MDGNTTITLSVIIAVVGCAIGVAGWLRGRDAKTDREGQFKGIVTTKLDTIINDAKENARQHTEIYKELANHGSRIAVIEESKKYTRRKTIPDE